MSTDVASARMSRAVECFLRSLRSGDWDGFEALLTADVVYDASVPGWRYVRRGRDAVMRELRDEWTGTHPWSIAEVRTARTADGEVVELELRGTCPGDQDHVPHEQAFRMANIFQFDGDKIVEHRVYCCGEWDEETIRRIEAELEEAGSTEKGRTT